MRLSVTQARPLLGDLCARAQDPREIIVLTRHGRTLAALVSIDEAERIWDLQEAEESGPVNPLTGKHDTCALPGFVTGVDGTPVTPREAALQMREIQMTRAAERRMLAAGGLEPVDGGEVGVTVQAPRRRWQFWRRTAG